MSKYLRNLKRPAFGMGGAMVAKDPRGPWKKTFDRIKRTMRGTAPGTGRNWIRDYLGRAGWGLQYALTPLDEQALDEPIGGQKLARSDAERINEELTEHLEALDKATGGPEAANAANKLLGQVFDQQAPPESLPPPLRKVYDAATERLNAMTDELLSLTHLHPYMEGFGLLNWVDVVKWNRGERRTHLRRLYQAGDPTLAAEERRRKKGKQARKNIRYRNIGHYRHRAGMKESVSQPSRAARRVQKQALPRHPTAMSGPCGTRPECPPTPSK